MRKYFLEKHWNLLFTQIALKGSRGIITLKALIDTGSTYTIVPIEILESIGYVLQDTKSKVRITSASGYIVVPRIRVKWIHTLGLKISNFHVAAHTLPQGIYAKSILGMDFLNKMNTIIDIKKGIIQVMD